MLLSLRRKISHYYPVCHQQVETLLLLIYHHFVVQNSMERVHIKPPPDVCPAKTKHLCGDAITRLLIIKFILKDMQISSYKLQLICS